MKKMKLTYEAPSTKEVLLKMGRSLMQGSLNDNHSNGGVQSGDMEPFDLDEP